MQMFETLLSSIPSNRSEMVNDLEIPEVTVSPYVWEEEFPVPSHWPEASLSSAEDVGSISTDSSLALSGAMTDSEIDYDRYKRYKRMDLNDRWGAMRNAMAAFPPEHLASLSSLQTISTEVPPDFIPYEPRLRDEELLLRMERFFDDCLAFEPDDPGLLELEEAHLGFGDFVRKYGPLPAMKQPKKRIFGKNKTISCVKCTFNGNDFQHYNNCPFISVPT